MGAIHSLADARRPPEPLGIDWRLLDAFSARVVLDHDDPADRAAADFRHRLTSLDREFRAGNPYAVRYWRLIETKMRQPLRSPLPNDAFYDAHLDRIIEASALLFHWTARHAPADHCDPPGD